MVKVWKLRYGYYKNEKNKEMIFDFWLFWGNKILSCNELNLRYKILRIKYNVVI